MLRNRTTLSQFLVEEQRRGHSHGDVNALLLDVAMACKTISRRVALGALLESREPTAESDAGPDGGPDGVPKRSLADAACDWFIGATERGGQVTGMVSPAGEEPHLLPTATPKGKHLLVFEALEGAQSLDVNGSAGSIFSILAAPSPRVDAATKDFLQPGRSQVAAGYAIYGPSTMLVLTLGRGVQGFTLDQSLGEFFLTHPAMRVAPTASEFAVDHAHRRFWSPAILRYVDECLAGKSGPRDRNFGIRWVSSLVAQTHRILVRGGVFLCPRDSNEPPPNKALRLLYETNPIAHVIEQAGGKASTGLGPILDVQPTDIHQNSPSFFFGASEEITRIERYYDETPLTAPDEDIELPFFGIRGLFRDPS